MIPSRQVNIIVAEDDDEDFELCLQAFEGARIGNPVFRVQDGEELMDFLLRRGRHRQPAEPPWPMLILLDLGMPKKDGLQTLKEIREHPRLKRIPVIVLTTSREDEDVARCYDLGTNAYMKKPVGIDQLIHDILVFKNYWLEVVEWPQTSRVPL